MELLGLYALKIVAPIRLSSDYSFAEINPRTESDPVLWLAALGVAAAAVAVWLARRRAPLLALALAVFVILLAPFSNLFYPARAIFAERFTYAASFACPLFLCAWLAMLGARSRSANSVSAGKIARLATAGLCLLIPLYGARTWVRNRDWALPLAERLERDAPDSAPAHLRIAETYMSRSAAAPTQEERQSLIDTALAHIDRALRIYPDYGQSEYKAAQILMSRNERAKAIERFTRAEKLLEKAGGSYSTLSSIHRLRGDCYLTLGKFQEAKEDLERHIKMMKSVAKLPEAMAFNLRGLAAAQLGLLEEALPYFDVAVNMRPDLPTYWNNRGFCRFHMKNWAGAINDYAKGMEVCRDLGILDAPSGDSVCSFMRRITDVYLAQARAAHAEGKDDVAKQAAAEAQEWNQRAIAQAQAAKAGPAPPRLPGSEPILPPEPAVPFLPEPRSPGTGSSMGSSMGAGQPK
jgi:tetratricopeptide (TPR) repeat protein